MMCNLSDGIERKGFKKGYEMGKLAAVVIIVMNHLKLSVQDAMIAVGIPESERDVYEAIVEKYKCYVV